MPKRHKVQMNLLSWNEASSPGILWFREQRGRHICCADISICRINTDWFICNYRQTSNISRIYVGNKIVDHSGVHQMYIIILFKTPGFRGLDNYNCNAIRQTLKFWIWKLFFGSRHKAGFGAVGLGSAQSRFWSRHKAGFGVVGLTSLKAEMDLYRHCVYPVNYLKRAFSI